MTNRYNRVMNNIQVTDKMHDRIIDSISHLDIDKTKPKATFKKYRKYLSIAACFVVLLLGTLVVHNAINLTTEPLQQSIPDITEYSSLDELSAAVGFKVSEIKAVPFDVNSVKYTAYWKELAQIQYAGTNNSIVFRMSAGSEDSSGDYNTYDSVKNCQEKDYRVTIKGNNGLYNLAVWQTGGFSYSISVVEGVSEKELLQLVYDSQG